MPHTLKKYHATCSVNNKPINLGFFKSVDQAASAYADYKYDLIMTEAEKQTDPRIAHGLTLHAEALYDACT